MDSDTAAFELSTDTVSAERAIPEWLELHDPQTNRVVYANTVTGQCSWTRPDSSIVPRDPRGEWWELIDEESNMPYYYNSTTGATEWDPPEDATVVPFHALLSSSVGKRLSLVVSNRGSIAFNNDQFDILTRKASKASLRSTDGRMSRKNSLAASASCSRNKKFSATDSPSLETNCTDATIEELASATKAGRGSGDQNTPGANSRLDSSKAETQIKLESGRRAESSEDATRKERHRISAQRHSQSETALETLKEALVANGMTHCDESDASSENGYTAQHRTAIAEEERDTFDESHPGPVFPSHQFDYTVPASATVEYFRNSEQAVRADNANGRPRNHSELPRNGGIGPERMSALDCYPQGAASSIMIHSHRNRSMPSIRADNRLYGMRTFANTQFAAQKRGFLRRKVPLDEMISYTSETIARPLMNLPREMIRDAVRSFRVIQRFMGNIDGEVSPKEKFGEILWLANKGIRNQVLRDEIFCQLSKQTTGNPSPTAVEKGWMLMGVLLYAFRPTQLMFPHLEAFVDSAAIPTVMLRRFLHLQMNRAKRAGGRTAEMSSKELRLAMTVPSRPLLFGGSLSEIMADPELVNRKTGLPKILELLTGLIISLGGESTEGLFRVPGDSDTVAMARLQFEAGHPDFSQIRDPNVPASLLKEWLRDLAEPLIPESFYDRCMSTPEDPEIAMEVLDVLPEPSLKVVKYLLKFFAHLLQPSVQAKTKMDSSNLALVFGPSLLRNPVNDLKDMFANLSGEQRFVLTLIELIKST